MRNALRFCFALTAVMLVAAGLVNAQTGGPGIVFFTGKGDLVFPFTNPTANGATPGTINNMVIGGTTPVAGNFTTLGATTLNATTINATTVNVADSLCANFVASLNTSAVDSAFFIAPKALTVTSVRAVWGVLAGAAFTANPMKATGTQAPSAGVALTTAAFDLNTTANTVATGTLSVTPANLVLAAGNRLAVDFTGTPTNIAGLAITVCMQ